MATTNDGIWTPDQTDLYKITADLNTMASTVQDALEVRANTWAGTTAQRTSFTPDAPEGAIWVDTNGEKKIWKLEGNSWIQFWPSPSVRRTFSGSQIYSSLESGVTITQAQAVKEYNEGDPFASVTLFAQVSGVSRPSGTQTTSLFTISPGLRATYAQGLIGLIQPGHATIETSQSGNVSIRWSPTSGTGAIRITGSYIAEI